MLLRLRVLLPGVDPGWLKGRNGHGLERSLEDQDLPDLASLLVLAVPLEAVEKPKKMTTRPFIRYCRRRKFK
jgi:hypothetical protein